MTSAEKYMHRCIGLALLAKGAVAPNPMVGAVLVHDDRIIGEGYHRRYGEPHAEVNCFAQVRETDRHLIEQATLYVCLEPCAHFGKTPPCADLCIKEKIKKVVIGCRDPFPLVNGKGIEKMKDAGIEVETGVLEAECLALNKRFFTFHNHHRPYVILKWAETGNRRIAGRNSDRLFISNEFTSRLVHKWRAEEAAIMVGTNTALLDDPALTTRLWPGKNPIRVVVDMDLRLPPSLKLFDRSAPTVVFNRHRHSLPDGMAALTENATCYYQVTEDVSIVHQVMNALYQLQVQSILVEGGAGLLQTFIDEEVWDEARVIQNRTMMVAGGLPAPELKDFRIEKEEMILSDTLFLFKANAGSCA